MTRPLRVVVEGDSDVEAVRAIVRSCGRDAYPPAVARGTARLDARLAGYVEAARHEPWVVFRDADRNCPVELRRTLLTGVRDLPPTFILRLAVTMTESWLMADAERFMSFFSVSAGRIPRDPDEAPHGKRALLDACARSRSRRIKEAMIAGNYQTGPLYVPTLNEYARHAWRPDAAAERSPSLRRALAAIRAMPDE